MLSHVTKVSKPRGSESSSIAHRSSSYQFITTSLLFAAILHVQLAALPVAGRGSAWLAAATAAGASAALLLRVRQSAVSLSRARLPAAGHRRRLQAQQGHTDNTAGEITEITDYTINAKTKHWRRIEREIDGKKIVSNLTYFFYHVLFYLVNNITMLNTVKPFLDLKTFWRIKI